MTDDKRPSSTAGEGPTHQNGGGLLVTKDWLGCYYSFCVLGFLKRVLSKNSTVQLADGNSPTVPLGRWRRAQRCGKTRRFGASQPELKC